MGYKKIFTEEAACIFDVPKSEIMCYKAGEKFKYKIFFHQKHFDIVIHEYSIEHRIFKLDMHLHETPEYKKHQEDHRIEHGYPAEAEYEVWLKGKNFAVRLYSHFPYKCQSTKHAKIATCDW